MRQVLALVDELSRRGVGLISLTENLDSTTPSGRLAMHMMAALAQYELEQKRAACEAGRRAILARGGRVGGRPRSLDPTKLKVARALIANGELTMTEVAKQVGVAPSTLYRALPGGRGGSAGARREAAA
jgi:DNA invertase Pin-like site-specific DNA recombinase